MVEYKYKCIVVDDDAFSRDLVAKHIDRTGYLQLCQVFENAIDASNYLKDELIDIIFLDIRMPEMSGMEFVQTLEDEYEIVLISTAEEYALEAFEKNVTDYIIKPVEYARFLQAVKRAKKKIDLRRSDTEDVKEFYVRSDSKLVRIPVDKILYIEAMADYVVIHTREKKHIVHFTMKGLESRLPTKNFVRIHRSFIVNTTAIELLEDNSILIKEKMLPIGSSYKDNLMDRLNLL
ncbi:MAG: LytR/AlgR family response regulator transcription factor [Cyclobacteriaceae bacterium]